MSAITDRLGERHDIALGESIVLDGHVVSRVGRSGEAAILNGFSIPHAMQGRGIGGTLIAAIEEELRGSGVRELRVTVQDMSCPIHGGFWTKRGYTHAGDAWTKKL